MSGSRKKTRALRVKIGYIGGGSRQWAHTLMSDLALCPHMEGEVRLYDIDRKMAQLNVRWGNRINQSPQALSQWRYSAPRTLREALTGVDFVIASILPGSIDMMGHDLDIPRKYGLVHPVGDTVGPAGYVRALRTVPMYEEIARAVERYCPDAWVINYTNPMSICTRTLYRVFPDVKAFGCCHEVFGTQRELAALLKEFKGVDATRDEIRVNVLGVNHFTWIDRASYNDVDLLELVDKKMRQKGVVRAIPAEEAGKMGYFEGKRQVVYDLYAHYGILPAAGERHLVEFLPFYAKDEETLGRWGVKATPYSYRYETYTGLPAQFRKRLADKKPFELKKSNEEGVRQMMAIKGLGDFRTNVNLPNVGQIAGLPSDAVVETNAYFTKDSVKPEFSGQLPAGVETLVMRAVYNQETVIEAALTGDRRLAFQAVLNDPLTGLTTDRARRMFDEMLKATRKYLPKGF